MDPNCELEGSIYILCLAELLTGVVWSSVFLLHLLAMSHRIWCWSYQKLKGFKIQYITIEVSSLPINCTKMNDLNSICQLALKAWSLPLWHFALGSHCCTSCLGSQSPRAFSNAFSRDFAQSFLGTYRMWSHVHFGQIMANPRLRKVSCTTRLQLQEKTPKKWQMEQPWASMRLDEPLSKQFLLIQWCGDSLEGRVAKLVPHGSGYRKVADWVGWNHDFGIGDGWNGDGWIWMNNDEEGKKSSNSWKSKDFASSEASIHICFAGRLHHWTEGFSTFTSNRCYLRYTKVIQKVNFSTSPFVIFRLLHVGEFPETNEASRSWRRNWGIDHQTLQWHWWCIWMFPKIVIPPNHPFE